MERSACSLDIPCTRPLEHFRCNPPSNRTLPPVASGAWKRAHPEARAAFLVQNLNFVNGPVRRSAPAPRIRNGRMAEEDEPNVWGELPAVVSMPALAT